MFTLFHALVLVGVLFGGILAARAGSVLFGTIGGVFGGIVGAVIGVIAGRVPWLLTLLSLARRGEDIRNELPMVLDLLVAEDVGRRGQGWAALTSAFPELVEQVRGYRIDSVDEGRRKTEALRSAA